jgi:alpha-D-ribose 1-methylphosphonate 5-triphosphate synthase subunit PhnG
MDERTDRPQKITATHRRQQWLRILACSSESELATALRHVDAATIELRKPEVGLAMITARVGESGEPFGLGEMTITRCVVQIGSHMGVGYVRGRAPKHARHIAVADALLQGALYEEICTQVVRPLARLQKERSMLRAAEVAGTRVQFLTMVRGN